MMIPSPTQRTPKSAQLSNLTSEFTLLLRRLDSAKNPALPKLAAKPPSEASLALNKLRSPNTVNHSAFRKYGQLLLDLLTYEFVLSTLWWPHRMPEESWEIFLRYHVVQLACYVTWFFLCDKMCKWAYRDELEKFWMGVEIALGMRETGGVI